LSQKSPVFQQLARGASPDACSILDDDWMTMIGRSGTNIPATIAFTKLEIKLLDDLVESASRNDGSTNIVHLPPNVWKILEKQAAAMSKITTYSDVQSRPTLPSSSSLPTIDYLYGLALVFLEKE
jgi:hypothetical protein